MSILYSQKFPIVVISGATGTGKTKLSIEIAKHYGGEVINADALQVYKGMDIATNKATEEERLGIPHHLLGFVNINRFNFTIHDFQKLALEKIEEIRSRNKMPIVVGGTNYYLESVLWHKLINVSGNEENEFRTMSNQELYQYLQQVDHKSAEILHPNNRRKIIRAIQIARNSNKTQFDHLNEQKRSRRFDLNQTVFLWLNADNGSLFPRLEKRVDEMIKLGLVSELEEINKLFSEMVENQGYTQGIFQAIGFKEFHEFFNSDFRETNREHVLESCVEKLKLANKQYVNVQNKWVKNRFLRKKGEGENVPLFKLDCSDVSQWAGNVFRKSICIIDQIILAPNEENYSDFVSRLRIQPEHLKDEVTHTPVVRYCETCDNQRFISEQQWQNHITSRRHQKRKNRLNKLTNHV